MRTPLLVALSVCTLAAGGCGAQQILLGTEGAYLFTVMDALALPGEDVLLRARLQAGDLLRGRAGQVVRFSRDGVLYKAGETDGDGVAAVTFTPPEPGDYRFVADVAAAGLPDEPPRPRELLIACRAADAPVVVVDLDKTIVASGFHAVLLGNPEPMPGSPEVLSRLARDRTVVFLTHRPDYFGPKSKQWLRAQGYPPGPVLLSTVGGFLKGSGTYKQDAIRSLKQRFKGIAVGIGDKVSDAQAYHDNGLKAFLIVQVPDDASADALEQLADSIKGLPDAVQVVTGWGEIEKALFDAGAYPRSAIERRLRDLAGERRKTGNTSKP
ncbi:MAG: hypothetical protein IMZ66_05205 [Planctomycetes bacterium]|nr:hypothetical protein [Planctomycetota bacterium]